MKYGKFDLDDTELESSDKEIEVEFIKSVITNENRQLEEIQRPTNFGLERRAKIKQEMKQIS